MSEKEKAVVRGATTWHPPFYDLLSEREAERDDYLGLFSRHPRQNREAMRWLNAHYLRMRTMQDVRDMEGHDEMVRRLLSVLSPEEVLQHYKPEERLAGLQPEERLAGLQPEERLAGLQPEEVLRHYGLDELLRHVRDLSPAERARVESKLPPAVLEVLRRFIDET